MRELAADGIPVALTCRVLNIARQPYYRWLAAPIPRSELEEAYLADRLFNAHRDDPEYGYRLLADEAREAGHDRCGAGGRPPRQARQVGKGALRPAAADCRTAIVRITNSCCAPKVTRG